MAKKTQKEMLNENIITLLGLEALPDERKAAILDQVSDLVQRRIMLRAMDSLKAEDKDRIIEIEKNPELVASFLAEKVPNLEKITEEEIIKVKKELFESLPKEA